MTSFIRYLCGLANRNLLRLKIDNLEYSRQDGHACTYKINEKLPTHGNYLNYNQYVNRIQRQRKSTTEPN